MKTVYAALVGRFYEAMWAALPSGESGVVALEIEEFLRKWNRASASERREVLIRWQLERGPRERDVI